MNESGGASIQDIQQGICDTGYRYNEKVSDAEREAACLRVGSPYQTDQSTNWFGGGIALATIIVLIIVGFSVLKHRSGKK